MSPRTIHLLTRIIQWGLAALLLTPFLVLGKSAIFPFIVGKFFIFRAGVEILLAFAVPLWIASPAHRPPRRLVLLLGVFFAVMGLSVIFGVDAHRSFWSNHERMTGMYSLLHFGVYALMLSSVFRNWEEWSWFFRAAVAVSAIEASIAILQRVSGHLFFIAEPGGRVWGTLGNYLYLANYMAFHLYLIFLLWVHEDRRAWKLGYGIVAALDFFAFLFADSRGAAVALVGSIFVLGVIYLLRMRGRVRTAAVALLAVITLSTGFAWLFRGNYVVQKTPFIGALARLSLGGTGQTRLMAWEVALEAWKEYPFFGWGPENFYIAFNAHYRPRFLAHSLYETWFDNAHSMYLNTLATIGIAGLAGYVSLIVAPWVMLLQAWRRGSADTHLFAVGSALVVAYAVTGLFVFDHFGSYLLFFMLIAMLAALSGKTFSTQARSFPARPLWIVGIAGAATAMFLVFATNVVPLRANQLSLDAATEGRDGNIEGLARTFERALAMPTQHTADIAIDFSRIVLDAMEVGFSVPPSVIDKAVLALEGLAADHPREVLAHFHRGQLLTLKALQTKAAADFDAAEAALQRATELSPRRQQLYFAWSRVRLARGDKEGAVVLLQEAVAFDETVGQPHFYLALALAQNKDISAAAETLDRAFRLGYSPGSRIESLMAAEIFRDAKRWSDARPLYEAVLVQGAERDPQLLFRLLEMTLRLGDTEKAKEFELRLLAVLPQASVDIAALKAQLEQEDKATKQLSD